MKRLYSFLLAVAMVLSTITMSFVNVAYAKADANTDLTLVAKTPKVKSGDTGLVELSLKIAGSQESIQESFGDKAVLEIKLPVNTDYYDFDDTLSDYSINGVVPTYSQDSKILRYEFKDVKTGISARIVLPVKTINGITPNGTNLEFTAKLSKADNTALIETSPAKIEIESSFNESISKTYAGVVGKDDLMPKKGDTVKWVIKGSILIPNKGGMYIKPDTDIVVKDTLPNGLDFDSAKVISGNLAEHKVNGKEITWTVKAPTLEEQEKKDTQKQNLFYFEIEMTTKVNLDTDKVQNLTNEVKLTASDISGKPKDVVSKANTTVLAGGNDIQFENGSWYPAVTYGPKDGLGNYAGGKDVGANPNPAVYDTARLRMFEYYNIALNATDTLLKKEGENWVKKENSEWKPADVLKQGYQKIVTKQTFSESLIFDGIFVWTPKMYYHSGVAVGPLSKYPQTTFTFKLKNNTEKKYEVKFPTDGGYITYILLDRKEMGLSDTDEVVSYDIEYKNADGKPLFGGVSLQTFPQFLIKKGTEGEVKWQTEYETTMQNGDVYLRKAEKATDNIGPRTATVIKPTDTKPKVMTTIEFVEKEGNVVKLGNNKVLLKFFNGRPSQISMDGDFSSVILLPYGVKLNDNAKFRYTLESGRLTSKVLTEDINGTGKILDENYKGTGQQLIKVTWDKDVLQPGNNLTVLFDVTITEDSSNSLNLVSYTSSSKTLELESMFQNVAPVEDDTDDINQDKVEKQQRIKAQNVYRMYTNEDLKIEKFVKGNLDKEFSKFGHANLGGKIGYKLNLTNTTGRNIYTLGFIDVLPSVNDLGIVDNVVRQSAFTPLLNGPINLPAEWADKIDVYYSTSKNPNRDDLYSKVEYDKVEEITKDAQGKETKKEVVVSYKHENPANAENPDWKLANDITDWGKIHSFKLEFKNNVVWVKGQNISLSFEMTAPEKGDKENLPDESILFPNLKEAVRTEATELRAAWNSFAVTTNGLLPTEPERVGVVLLKESGAVRVKYFIEGTEIELDNPKAGERVKDEEDKGWYTVKEKGSEIGEKYDSTTDEFQPKTLVKDGKTYVLTEKKVRNDSAPVEGETKEETQYIIYEYKLLKGDVYVKYFVEGTDIELENPKAKDKTNDGWYTVKKDSPVGEEYKTDNEELKPKTLKDKDGKTYVLTKTETRKDSDPKDGNVKEETQYVKYEYKKTGAVRVKYFIEGTEIELDNPKAG
ncbi:MAG: isopeptide-forming domain-containing fimbrial protein [Peptoniphilaceae bacterium]|nr:isopeptide-forming domain-containing fimbrial protein [Peptoniphilaceae bacterium]